MRSFPTACVLMNRSFDHARWSRFGGRLGSFSLQRVAFVLQIVICGLHQCVNTCRSFLWRVFCKKKRSLAIVFQAPNPWQGCVSCIPLEIVYFFFAGQCDEERYWVSYFQAWSGSLTTLTVSSWFLQNIPWLQSNSRKKPVIAVTLYQTQGDINTNSSLGKWIWSDYDTMNPCAFKFRSPRSMK